MSVKLNISSVCCLLILLCGCDSKSVENQHSTPASPSQTESAASPNTPTVNASANQQPVASTVLSAASVDVCALIDKAEIASVQGAQVQSTVPSVQTSGALAISQCYYTVTSADGSKNLSVHLQVMQADPKSGSPNAVKDYWERSFGREAKGDEEDKESGKPLPVSGIGEEAFWTGNAKAGAVYALKKGRMVRLSLGGPDDMKTKIGKSKTLIANALRRLT
jgi:hypothetical protein